MKLRLLLISTMLFISFNINSAENTPAQTSALNNELEQLYENLQKIGFQELDYLSDTEYEAVKKKILEQLTTIEQLEQQLGIEKSKLAQSAAQTADTFKVIDSFRKNQQTIVKKLLDLLYGPLPIVYTDSTKTTVDWPKTKQLSGKREQELEALYSQLRGIFKERFEKLSKERIAYITQLFDELQQQYDPNIVKQEQTDADVEKKIIAQQQQDITRLNDLFAKSIDSEFLESLTPEIMQARKNMVQQLIKKIGDTQQQEQFEKKLIELQKVWQVQVVLNQTKALRAEELASIKAKKIPQERITFYENRVNDLEQQKKAVLEKIPKKITPEMQSKVKQLENQLKGIYTQAKADLEQKEQALPEEKKPAEKQPTPALVQLINELPKKIESFKSLNIISGPAFKEFVDLYIMLEQRDLTRVNRHINEMVNKLTEHILIILSKWTDEQIKNYQLASDKDELTFTDINEANKKLPATDEQITHIVLYVPYLKKLIVRYNLENLHDTLEDFIKKIHQFNVITNNVFEKEQDLGSKKIGTDLEKSLLHRSLMQLESIKVKLTELDK